MKSGPPADVVLPVLQEQLEIGKRERVTGVVQVRKSVQHEELQFELPPLERVQIEVERVPVGRVVEAPTALRTEGDVTIVPVHEERWVLRRELVLTEELHLRRHRSTLPAAPQRATRRREQVEVSRLPAPPESETPIPACPAADDAEPGNSYPDERNTFP
jgi:uncharacterized protein (TIGR02271 family)